MRKNYLKLKTRKQLIRIKRLNTSEFFMNKYEKKAYDQTII